MLQPVGEGTQGQCFRVCHGFLPGTAIGESTRNLHDLRNPAAIGFLLCFDVENHAFDDAATVKKDKTAIRPAAIVVSLDQSVTAPRDAGLTTRAYFANTPRV